jgi:hypothetical protein
MRVFDPPTPSCPGCGDPMRFAYAISRRPNNLPNLQIFECLQCYLAIPSAAVGKDLDLDALVITC